MMGCCKLNNAVWNRSTASVAKQFYHIVSTQSVLRCEDSYLLWPGTCVSAVNGGVLISEIGVLRILPRIHLKSS